MSKKLNPGKIFILGAILMCLIGVFPLHAMAVGENLFDNFGFEDAFTAPIVGNNATVEVVDNTLVNPAIPGDKLKAFGSKCLKIFLPQAKNVPNPGDEVNMSYVEFPLNAPLINGHKYGYVAFMYSTAGDADTNPVLRFRWSSSGFKNGSTYGVEPNAGFKLPGGVGDSSTTITSAVDTGKIQFYMNKPENFNLYIDNVFVMDLTPEGTEIMPDVASSLPSDGDLVYNDVSSVTLNFNYPLDPATVKASNFSISNGATIASVSQSDDFKSVTLTFGQTLTSGSFTVTAKTSLMDVFKRPLPSEKTVTFTVNPTQPMILFSVPSDGTTGVLLNDMSLLVKFNMALDPDTVNTSNITCNQPGSIANVAMENANKDVRIFFNSPLTPGTQYTVSFNKDAIKNSDGDPMMDSSISDISFTTAGTPVLEDSWPKDGEKKVDIKHVLNFKFSEYMDALTMTAENITVNGRSGLIDRIVADTTDAKRFAVVFKKLTPYTTYTVNFSNLKSLAGLDMEPGEVSFTTGDDVENMFLRTGFEEPSENMQLYGGTLSSALPYSGAYAIRANAAASGQGLTNIKITGLQVGKTYECSYYARMDPNSIVKESIGIAFSIIPNYESGSGVSLRPADFPTYTPQSPYARVVGRFTIPEYSSDPNSILESITCSFLSKSDESLSFWIDDFKIYEIDTLAVSTAGTLYDGAFLGSNDSLTLAFNREMDVESVTAAKIFIDNVQVTSVELDPNSNRRFIIQPATALNFEAGSHKIKIEGVMDILGDELTTEFNIYKKPYEVASFKLLKGTTDITDGPIQTGTISAAAEGITNDSGTDGGAVIILALYKGNALEKISTQEISISNGETTTDPLITGLTVPTLEGADYTLKAYLWTNLESMKPLVNLIKTTE